MTAQIAGTEFVLAALGGAVLALPYVVYARRLRAPVRLFGIGLVVAAGIYVAFAVAGGTRGDLVTEVAGVVVFGMLAFLGIRHSAWLLALGWASHIGWDLLLHPADASSYAPWWYPAVCLGFDLVVAGAVVARFQTGRRGLVFPP